MEIWKAVPGLENRYFASNTGKIKGIFTCGGHGRPRILKTCLDECGYEKIYIKTDTGKRTTRVHILVCLAFVGPKPSDRHTVNHKDGNKLNNTPDNLEWATFSQQMVHAYKVLDMGKNLARGYGNHWLAVYTDDEIREIRRLYQSGMGYHKIMNHFGNKSSWVTIQRIITGKCYQHVV